MALQQTALTAFPFTRGIPVHIALQFTAAQLHCGLVVRGLYGHTKILKLLAKGFDQWRLERYRAYCERSCARFAFRGCTANVQTQCLDPIIQIDGAQRFDLYARLLDARGGQCRTQDQSAAYQLTTAVQTQCAP